MKTKNILVLIAIVSIGTASAQTFTTLGVGIASPAGTLHIHNATPFDPVNPFDPNPRDQIFDYDYETVFRSTNPNTGTTAADGFTITQGNYNVTMQNLENGHIRLATPGGIAILSNTGRFGIGDTAYNAKFNVAGTTRLGGATTVNGTFSVTATAAFSDTLKVGNYFRVLSDGNVRAKRITIGNYISLTSPSDPLEASTISVGSIQISNLNGISHGNQFRLSPSGNLELQGHVTAGASISTAANLSAQGNITAGGTLSVGNGFYCDAQGNAKVKELRVTLTDWPDYVFGEGYRLAPLTEVEDFISEKGHLPQMPSAAEVEANGADLGEMNRLLMQKVEELTLYVIDLQKQIEELRSNK